MVSGNNLGEVVCQFGICNLNNVSDMDGDWTGKLIFEDDDV